LGGKAQGLLAAHRFLAERAEELAGLGFAVDIPSLAILATGFFDGFLAGNDLLPLLAEEPPDQDVALAFERAAIPGEMVGDLWALAEEVRVPLAVRSSSALEDALGQPFAGVYGTKMVPCNQLSAEARFHALVDAIKFVWASVFFAEARGYQRAVGRTFGEEKMAVIIQEVVGERHGARFYPEISGVAKSFNFYPVGAAQPEEGVVDLALGLGKTIVDGGLCWSFSPPHPHAVPPVGSAREFLDTTQREFWAVNVGPPPAYDPMSEAEFLVRHDLAAAEEDGALRYAASTYDGAADRIYPGLGRRGVRLLDFAPLLQYDELPLGAALRRILALCEAALDAPVEVEFALALAGRRPPRFGFLQVRPLLVARATVEVSEEELASPRAVVASRAALGNGTRELCDVIYVDPERFEAARTTAIAAEIERLNRPLAAAGRPYLLLGFGRWGSADPWLGIPVRWDQISGARAIVEATLPQMNPEPSQGSHFFHNLSSFEVCYLTVPPGGPIAWEWLSRQELIAASEHVRHVRCRPLALKVDGRTRRGVVLAPEEP